MALLTWPRVVRGWHRDLNSSSVWSVDQDQEEAGRRHSRCWAANGLVDIIRRACYLRYHSDLHDTLIAQLFE